MNFALSVFANILADIVFAVGGGVLFFIAVRRRRGRLLAFFGVTQHRVLRIYLSSFRGVVATDRFGEERVKHSVALPDSEFRGLPLFDALFRADPYSAIFALLPFLKRSTNVTFDISLAPEVFAGPLDTAVVALGGPRHNAVTAQLLVAMQSPLSLHPTDDGWCVALNGETSKVYNAILVRGVVDGSVALVAAGIQGRDTEAAIRYLAARWHELARQFGSAGFGVALEFAQGKSQPRHIMQVPLRTGHVPAP